MQFTIEYNKAKTIQALRFHFIARREIKLLLIMVNVFAVLAAVLFYMKKVRPEPFLLGSAIWVSMMATIWYLLPQSIFKRTKIFKDSFLAYINEQTFRLENEKGAVTWQWEQFDYYFETPHFFHLYFNSKSFFLLPKEDMLQEQQHDLRGILNKQVGTKK